MLVANGPEERNGEAAAVSSCRTPVTPVAGGGGLLEEAVQVASPGAAYRGAAHLVNTTHLVNTAHPHEVYQTAYPTTTPESYADSPLVYPPTDLYYGGGGGVGYMQVCLICHSK